MMKIFNKLKSFQLSLWFLKVIFILKPLFVKWGIDAHQLEVILKTKLLVNQRRPNNPLMGQNNGTKKMNKNMDWIQLFLFLFMGVFYIPVILTNESPSFGYVVFFIGLMGMVLMTSIMEFSTILIDEKDNYILFPKPVNDSTITFSRYLLMTFYVLKISIIFAFPVWIYTFIAIGILPALLFIVQVIWLSILLVLILCMIYLLLFQLKNPHQIKQWISKFQILVTIFFSLQFYGVSYLMKIKYDQFKISDISWIAAIPATWVAAWQNALVFHQTDSYTIRIALIGLIAPLILGWIFIKYLSKNFNQKIAVMSHSEGESIELPKEMTTVKNTPLSLKLSKILCKSPVEQSAFRTVWALTNRFTDFKMRFYPSFGLLIAYAFIIIVKIEGDWNHKLHILKSSQGLFIGAIYFSGLVLNGALGQLTISNKFKAAWIYHIAPIAHPGEILLGAFKTIFIKYFSPMYFLISAFMLTVFGVNFINDIILGYISVCIVGIVINLIMYNSLPFSIPMDYYKGKWYMGFLLLFIQFIMGGFHYLIYRWETAVWVAIPILIVVLFYMFKYYGKQTWSDIYSDSSE